MKNTVLFCTGLSGSGKSYFIQNVLPINSFYNLKSATTRPMRDGEMNGREYYFRDEKYFETEKFATKLWVNEAFWKPGVPKWLYGVPEFEIFDHIGQNFTYDVIQPRYVRQMIDWFHKKRLANNYDFKIMWFQPMLNSNSVVKNRQNMPDDVRVRQTNTCNINDFKMANLQPDFTIQFSHESGYNIQTHGDGLILPNLDIAVLLLQYSNRTK
jgi:hypothetical protein